MTMQVFPQLIDSTIIQFIIAAASLNIQVVNEMKEACYLLKNKTLLSRLSETRYPLAVGIEIVAWFGLQAE